MKKQLLFVYLMAMAMFGFSQSNVIIFTENGARFKVVLNGILQNADFETNVMITDLIAPSYKVKIVFEDATIPDLDKTIYFQENNEEATYRLLINKKGDYVLRFFNAVPIAQAPPRPESLPVVVYTTTPAVSTTTITRTTTTMGGNSNPDQVNMNVNAGGVNMNVNINTGNESTTYTETYTTTTTVETPMGEPQGYILPGYTGYYGCPRPMSPRDFENAKRSIASKDFSDSKLRMAKQVLESNCLLSAQVKQLMELFDYESDKLELAKFAFGYTLDTGNYYQLNDAFEYESSIEELDDYIHQYQR